MPNNISGRLQRPASGIGRTEFPIDIDLEDFGTQSVNAIVPVLPAVARAAAEGAARAFAAGGGYGGPGGRGPVYALPPPAAGGGGVPPGGGAGRGGRGGGYGGDPRFSAYTRGSSFYGGRGGGFASVGALGGRFGFGGAGYAALGIFGASALREVTQNLIEAASAFETFERTVQATESTSEAAAVRWEELLDIAERTVGIDIAGLVSYNSQLRVIGVEATRVNAVLEGTVKSVSELGRGVHVSNEALAQLTDGIVRNHLNVRDWRAIVARIPQFLEAASIALGTTVKSLDDFKQGSEAANISVSEGILRTMEQLASTAQGLQGTYVAAVDRFNEASLRLRATLGEDIKDAVTPVISGLAEAMNSLNEAISQTPQDRFRRLYQQLEDVRGSRTLLGDNPLEREALRELRRFQQQYPELFDTSPGAFRAYEARSRQTPYGSPVERPTDASIDYFQDFFSNQLFREEFLRQDLRRAGGDFAAQIEASEARVQNILQQIRDASPQEFVDTEYLPSIQAVIEGLERELEAEFRQLRVLREINTEEERRQRLIDAQTAALDQRAQIQRNIFIEQHEGYFGIGVGTPERTATREARRQREGQAALNAFIRRNQGYSGLGVGRNVEEQARLSRAQRQLEVEAGAVALRRFIERNQGYAGIPTDGRAAFPSLEELERRQAAAFRESGRGGAGDRNLNRLVGEALQDGTEGLDTDALRQQYDDYIQARIDGEREAQRAAERSARQYTRLWERTFSGVADIAIDAIFDRNLSFGKALSGLAQDTLKDFSSFYIRQLLGGESGGLGALTGGGTAAGAGVALGGASLLFPTEFNNLFEEIGNTLGRIPQIFHSPSNDLLYGQTTGARLRRALESNEPDARTNARDLTDNIVQGFENAGRTRGQSSELADGGDLVVNINIGENDEAMISFAVRLSELISKGLVQFP